MGPSRIFSMAALVLAAAALAAAQEPPATTALSTLTVGSRVRVLSTAVQARLDGVVVEMDERALTVAPSGGLPLKVPLGSITQLDVGLGRRGNARRGLVIGLLAGLALGLAFSVDPGDCGFESDHFCSRGEAIAGGVLTFGGLGAGIGALVKTDRWAPLTMGPPRPGITDARRRGVGVAVAFRF
jgi:hypothetical protein